MTLMAGVNAVDPTLLFYAGKWWLFTGIREIAGAYSDVELFLFFSDSLFTTEWKSHPLNPVVSDVTNARPAGRIYLNNGKLYRPSQNCTKIYGSNFNINEIVSLSETEYSERTIISVQPDKDLNVQGTHTFAHVGHLTVVDGFYRKLKFPTRIQR